MFFVRAVNWMFPSFLIIIISNFRAAHKSSKKLLEQCQKLDKIWGHVFSAVITLNSPESWYRKLRELIDWQQQGPLWMSQTKVRLETHKVNFYINLVVHKKRAEHFVLHFASYFF